MLIDLSWLCLGTDDGNPFFTWPYDENQRCDRIALYNPKTKSYVKCEGGGAVSTQSPWMQQSEIFNVIPMNEVTGNNGVRFKTWQGLYLKADPHQLDLPIYASREVGQG